MQAVYRESFSTAGCMPLWSGNRFKKHFKYYAVCKVHMRMSTALNGETGTKAKLEQCGIACIAKTDTLRLAS